MTPFDWVKQITVTKQPWDSFSDSDKDSFNSFIINRALSMHPPYIQVVEMAMTYQMPAKSLYQFYCDVIPKQTVWAKWVKASSTWNEDELKTMATYFECSQREAKDIIDLLEVSEKDVILLEVKGFEGKPKKKKNDKKSRRI